MVKTKWLKEKRIAQSRNNWREVANLSNALGGVLQEEGKLQEALEQHQDELQACGILEDKLGSGVAHRRIGEVLCEMGRTEEALNHQKLHLQLAIEAKSLLEQQRAYATLGRTHLDRAETVTKVSERQKALAAASDNFLASLTKCRQLPSDSVAPKELCLMRARLYLNLGVVADMKGNDSKAIDLLTQASTIARQNLFTEDQFRCHFALSAVYIKLERYAVALEETKFLVTLSAKLSTYQKVEALVLQGKVHTLMMEFDKANQTFSKAYKISIRNKVNVTELKKSIRACRDLCQLSKRDSQDLDQNETLKHLENMADYFALLKCPNKAIEFYKQVIDEGVAFGKGDELAAIYYSIAETLKENRQLEEAKKYYTIEYELRLKKDNKKEAIETLLLIADVAEMLDESLNSLENYYETAFNLAVKAGNPKTQARILKLHTQFSHLSSSKKEALKAKLQVIIDENDLASDCEESGSSELESDIDISGISDSSSEENNEKPSCNIVSSSLKAPKTNSAGETPLHVASREGKANTVKSLLEKGYSTKARDNVGWLPIHEACNHGCLEIVELLVAAGSPIDERGDGGVTPLYDACCNGHLDIVRYLLKIGASAIIKAEDGNTPLDAWRAIDQTELSEFEREEWLEVEKELMQAMEEAGCQASSISLSRNVESSYKKVAEKQKDESSDDEISPPRRVLAPKSKATAVKSYITAITSLGSAAKRSHSPQTTRPPSTSTKGSKSALLPQEELIGEDFIEDDLGDASRKRKRNMSKSVLDFVSAKKSRKSPERTFTPPVRSSQRKVTKQTKITSLYERINSPSPSTDTFDFCSEADDIPIIDDFSPTKTSPIFPKASSVSISKSDSTPRPTMLFLPRSSPAVGAPHPPAPAPNSLRVHVRVEDKTLLVPIAEGNLNCTIEWLAGEVARRYYMLNGIKPEVRLETSTGALLLPSDPITLVLGNSQNNELKATVTGWDLPPLQHRYTQECRHFGQAPVGDIATALSKAESSAALILDRPTYTVAELKPVVRAIQRHPNLHTLNLSFSKLGDAGFCLLLDSMPLLPGLLTLALQNTGLSAQAITDWKNRSDSSCKTLTTLNLSYNTLTGCTLSHLNFFLTFHQLVSLDLTHCCLDIQQSSPLSQCSTLQKLLLSYNSFSLVALKELLSKVLSLKHLSLSSVSVLSENNQAVAPAIANLLGTGIECPLEKLDLSYMNLTNSDIENICPYLYRCSHLTELNLSHNNELTCQSLMALLSELEVNVNIPLKSLALHGIQSFTDKTLVQTLAKILNSKFSLQKSFEKLSVKSSDITKSCLAGAWKSTLSSKANITHLGSEIFLESS